ncbi:MAG: LOG family protein [Ignavibacteria bacterium]|nr:LOG family protein [Ignavibacteria bacterium]
MINGHLDKAPKAYNNREFLNSPQARTIRILTEYLEPYQRLEKNKIKDTIVFFGSARLKSRSESKKILDELNDKLKKLGNTSLKEVEALQNEIKIARKNLELSKYYEDTVELTYMLTKWSKGLKGGNKFVVCSGGGPGIMEAANKGAHKAKGLSVGLNISLPFEQYPNKYITSDLNFEFHYFFMRKFWFAYLAKAIVIMPGGLGTLDELCEVLTLVQTYKLKKKMTIVVYGTEFWEKVINLEFLAENNMIDYKDLELIKLCDTPQEAFEYLKKELKRNYVK